VPLSDSGRRECRDQNERRSLKPLAVRDQEPIAVGTSRLVYQHPSDPDLLVKVMRPDFLARRNSRTRWYHRLKPTRMLSIFIRELREWLVLYSKGEKTGHSLEQVVGIYETDLGIGMLVRAVRDPAGRIAPRLDELLEAGQFDEDAARDLDAFCAAVAESAVTLGALKPGNIVYGVDGAGQRQFILIDGFGEGALIPLRGAFPILNRLAKRQHVRRLRARCAALRRKSEPKRLASGAFRALSPAPPPPSNQRAPSGGGTGTNRALAGGGSAPPTSSSPQPVAVRDWIAAPGRQHRLHRARLSLGERLLRKLQRPAQR
jgi:hypothetical protein